MISNKNVLNLKIRQKIYNYILETPGLHVRELSRRTNIPRTTLNYHLRYLKKQELILERKEVGYKRIYATKNLGEKDKKILNLLRQEIPCKILIYFIFNLISSQKELSKELDEKPAVISFHIKKLIDMEIIEPAIIKNGLVKRLVKSKFILRKPIGPEIIYILKNFEVSNTIYKLLITHKNNLADKYTIDAIDSLLYWINELVKQELPQKANDSESGVDSVIETAYEICPHPYHV